jgi:hypothetical protein
MTLQVSYFLEPFNLAVGFDCFMRPYCFGQWLPYPSICLSALLLSSCWNIHSKCALPRGGGPTFAHVSLPGCAFVNSCTHCVLLLGRFRVAHVTLVVPTLGVAVLCLSRVEP